MIRRLIAALRSVEGTSFGDVGGALLLFVILMIGTGWVNALQVAP
jgi:hypothetical protein